MNIKVFHASDLHYCEKHLKWVDQAFGFACDEAIARHAEVAILSGDSFDASVNLHEPAVTAFFSRIRRLADHMPVCVLQGTQSHDRPGSLTPLRFLGGKFPILVADRISQAAWNGGKWIQSEGWAFDEAPAGSRILLSLLPSVNKGAVAASVGADNASEQVGELILSLCKGWAGGNLAARAAEIPTAIVTHGTVNGSVTECASALVSMDHEFTSGTLFAGETSAVLIGHIHAAQEFRNCDRVIAYPGSITKLIYGHRGKSGFLMWDVRHDGASYTFHDTPCRDLVEIDFTGAPDMNTLARAAASCDGQYIRLRFSIDEGHRASVDKRAILEMFGAAADVKIEARINPIQRQRSAGIVQATSVAERLAAWCDYTNTDPAPLLERLAQLEAVHVDDITKEIAA